MRRWLAAVTLGVAVLVLVGCGGHEREWDSKALNKAVTDHLATIYSQDFDVACPPSGSLKAGGTISCPVRHLDPVLAVTVTADSDGKLHFTDSVHG
jgi:hypothetical protein